MMVAILSMLTSATDTAAAVAIDFLKRSCLSVVKDASVMGRDTANFTTCVAGLQTVAAAPEYLPGGQSVQTVEASPVYWPGTQLVQTVDPEADAYLPASQSVHRFPTSTTGIWQR